jgi:hypothetical protein
MPTFRLSDQRWSKYLNFQTIDYREGESESALTARCMEADPFPGVTLLNDFRTEFVAHYIDMATAKVVRNDDGEKEWILDVYANVKAVLTKDVEADTEAEARDLFDLHLTFLMPAFDGDNPGMWLYEWDAELEEGQAITCEVLHRNLAASPST